MVQDKEIGLRNSQGEKISTHSGLRYIRHAVNGLKPGVSVVRIVRDIKEKKFLQNVRELSLKLIIIPTGIVGVNIHNSTPACTTDIFKNGMSFLVIYIRE